MRKYCRGFVGVVLFLAVLATTIAPVRADDVAAAETKAQRDARMEWWREARFGMFIHWGPYAVPAGTYHDKKLTDKLGEWIMYDARIPVAEYETYAAKFNPVKFDAERWADVAKAAGMKYLVITAKHCDGFAMYPSKASKYNIADATPFKRDPMAELAKACADRGIRFCFYYSHCWDWHEANAPGFINDWDFGPMEKRDVDVYFKQKSLPQVEELAATYKPALMWFDVPDLSPERSRDFLNVIRRHVPNCIVNDRVGNGLGDYVTPEQFIPANGFPGKDWETCMTINDTWGFKTYDTNFKSTQTLVRNLIDIASKGGNYLLNIGPTAEGVIPEPEVERLKEMGDWLKVNGEAIYGTTGSPLKKTPAWGRITQKPGKLYLHVFDPPAGEKLIVPIMNKVARVYMLGNDDPHQFMAIPRPTREGLKIRILQMRIDKFANVIVLELENPAEPIVLAPVAQMTVDETKGTIHLTAEDADIIGTDAKLDGEEEKNVGYWTNAGDYLQWRVNVRRRGDYLVAIDYACEPGSEGSEFQVAVGTSSVVGKVAATRSWNDYKTVTLPGTIHIAEQGVATVTVKPVKKPGLAVMNLRSVTLIQVGESESGSGK